MSLETDEMFTEFVNENEEDLQKEQVARKKAMQKTIEMTKPFKDLLLGKEKEWAEVKSKVSDHIFSILMVGNDIVTRDFLAGIKHCVELFESRVDEFDSAFAELGGK